MKYEEFRDAIQKKRGPQKRTVTNSWGVKNAFRHIRKNKWYNIGEPLTEHEFYSVIREVNNLLIEEFLKGKSIVFPYKMGTVELRKEERGVSFVDGKLKNTYPVDWDSTLRLWYKDAEAKEKKILIRKENKFVYRIFYNKYSTSFKNKAFYKFFPNRSLKRTLKEKIIKGKIDTVW